LTCVRHRDYARRYESRADEAVVGAGEQAVCPIWAGIANAIFDATGVRVRTMRLTSPLC